MSFSLNGALAAGAGLPYYDADYKRDNHIAGFTEICKILTKWEAHLFPEKSVSEYNFARLERPASSIIFAADSLDQKMESIATNLHRIAYHSLLANQVPDEETLTQIQHLFKKFSDSIEASANQETKKEFADISGTPRLVMRCSELFVKNVAERIGKSDIFNYSLDTTLTTWGEMYQSDPKITSAMQRWADIAFKPEFTTKQGLAELARGASLPYCSYYQLSAEKSLEGAAKYLAAIAYAANQAERDATDSEVAAIREMLQDTLTHLEEINEAYDLYTLRREALSAIEETKKALAAHIEESAERESPLAATYVKTIAEHEEVLQAQKWLLTKNSLVPILGPVLATEAAARQEIMEVAKETLDKTVQDDQAKANAFRDSIADEVKYSTRALRLPCSKNKEQIAAKISEETFDMLTRLKDNIPLAIICMQEYLHFGQARADRELKTASWWPW